MKASVEARVIGLYRVDYAAHPSTCPLRGLVGMRWFSYHILNLVSG
jgi:hypothetical protein